jgi:hypothetical protein
LPQNVEDPREEEERAEELIGKSQGKADGTEISVERVETADTGAPGPSTAADR